MVALSGPGSLLISDAFAHASLVDACRLSRARVIVTPHNDVDAVEAALAARDEERALVVTDSGVQHRRRAGAAAPAARGLPQASRPAAGGRGTVWAFGDRGRGLLHEVGLAGAPDVVMTTTMSKSLGSQGGVVLAPAAVRDHLIDAARTFIFDTGLTPSAVGAALAALGVLIAEPWRAEAVMTRAHELATMCDVPEPRSRRWCRSSSGTPMSRLPPRRPAWMPGCGWAASARRRFRRGPPGCG